MELLNFETGMKKIAILSQTPLDKDTIVVYYDVLKHLTDDQWNAVIQAYGQNVKTAGKLPATGYLLSLSRPATKTQAVETWAYLIKLKREAHRTQDYEPETGTIYKLPPEIRDNPLLDKLVRHLGGWQEFCAKTLTEWDWNRFREAFESYSSDPVFSAQALKSYTQATLEFQERKALMEGE